MTAKVGNVIENTALHRRKEFLSTPLFLLPIQFMGRKMRSIEVKQHVIYYKNDTSFSIKQAVVYNKTTRRFFENKPLIASTRCKIDIYC